ncbi:hypothetical protein BDQ12DRAFT_663333 [Crucibulum laeve]|uniref:Carbohydrate esterase family 16 protein n=1 Tax=Crucibulum laeve TaxID=68775 RepID=A0A5C3M9E5_9AGAR|nr:hypothetical protein BDQ12DRAFT_663333 [Crucibulum laeve]
MQLIAFILATVHVASAIVLPRDGVHLAVSPKCGSFSGAPADVNAGLKSLSSYKTVVSFGDEFSADGGVSNGPSWVDYLASAAGASLEDWAASGAVVDNTQWPGVKLAPANDFLMQFSSFVSRGKQYDRNTTLYTIFFGIEDYKVALASGGADLTNIAQSIVYQIAVLSSSPVFGRNFLIVDNHGLGTESPTGAAFKKELFSGLGAVGKYVGANVGFVDLSNVWTSVLGSSPGYAAFGYTSPGACLASAGSTAGVCADPDHTLYWTPGTPTTATHRLITNYVQQVLSQCKSSY